MIVDSEREMLHYRENALRSTSGPPADHKLVVADLNWGALIDVLSNNQ